MHVKELPEKIINSIKVSKVLHIIASRLNFISDDRAYINHFNKAIGPQVYHQHLDENFICCAFCIHLQKSSCHEYCFSCGKNIYDQCSTLLPGTFSFIGSHFDALENHNAPWIFKTPCTAFERLSEKKYYRNFNSYAQSITVANYEALEGIFTGISRGKSPCHICASVNIDIYNNCVKGEKNSENEYCSEIIEQIADKYKAIIGMVKYVE
ncbi:MAG: hypothetical protein N2489_10670 [Clostridia bacterium]|nr:hypothetical protein [Clostridia bacterium]